MEKIQTILLQSTLDLCEVIQFQLFFDFAGFIKIRMIF
jgi:hypothetical protein